MTEQWKLYSFNVRGLSNKHKRNTIFQYLKKNHKGIIFIQETHSTPETEKKWQGEFGGKIYFSHGTSQSKGVAILVPQYINFKLKQSVNDNKGRILLLDCDINDEHFTLVNFYAPTKDNVEEQRKTLLKLQEIISDHVDSSLIIGGDFNCCLNPKLDKRGGRLEKPSTYVNDIKEMNEQLELIDVWRTRNPYSERFTHRQNSRAGLVFSRLDFFLISTHLSYSIVSCDILTGIMSDHSIIEIKIKHNKGSPKGKGFWKFNNSLLKDTEYITKIKNVISNFEAENNTINDAGLKWDALKCKLRGETISYSSYICKERRKAVNELKIVIEQSEKNLPLNKYEYEIYNTAKMEFDNIQSEITSGIIVRSRAQFIEEGERNTKFFLGLEKRNQNIKNIQCLIDDDDKYLTKPAEILDEQVRFYGELYSDQACDSSESDKFLNAEKTLTPESKDFCDKPLSIDECAKALSQLKNNKSPGTDGFTTDFYKFFWKDIKNFVFESINYGIKSGKLSTDQRRGIISLIPKKEKDPRYLKNWRPLTLLNTDYKILTKLMANRLQNCIDEIVSHDQCGYIKGRYVGENIRTIADIIEITKYNTNPGIITLIDFEKAFDTVNWNYLFSTLRSFGFGEFFINCVKVIYNDINSCCLNNGNATPFFSPKRGIRQGCPVSALLFVLVVETLAIVIRNNNKIEGISINNSTYKIGQLADDTTLFLKDENSLRESLNVFESFSKCSGLKLNKTKTEIFYLGNTNHKPNTYGLSLAGDTFKSLGIYFSKDDLKVQNLNFEEKFLKFKHILNLWMQRDLSLKGKITILKTLAIPQLLYACSVLYVPDEFIYKVNNEIVRFIWNHKPAKIKWACLISDYTEGGLRAPDIKCMIHAQKITWIKRMLFSKNTKWRNLALYASNITEYELTCKYHTKFMNKQPKSYYKQILDIWYDYFSIEPEMENILFETLYYNKFILVNKRPIQPRIEWSRQDIRHIGDIIDDHGCFKSPPFTNQTEHLYFNSIKSAIPIKWRKQIKNNFHVMSATIPPNERDMIEKLNSKTVYWNILGKHISSPTSKEKWISTYPFLNDEDFKKIYRLSFNTTKDVKLQTLQFKILHRIIPTRSKLYDWKISENDSCLYCHTVETIEHFIYYCENVRKFWKLLEGWIKKTLNINISLGLVDTIFGIFGERKDVNTYCINFTVIHAKQYICSKRWQNQYISYSEFMKRFEKHLAIEKYRQRLFIETDVTQTQGIDVLYQNIANVEV